MQKPKLGGQETLRLFIKGNDDLVNSLLSLKEGGQQLERGFRELVNDKYGEAFKVEIVREPAPSWDILLRQLDGISFPQALHDQGLHDPFITAQFASRLYEEQVDIVVLSIMPNITYTRWRHQSEGYLICPPHDWQRQWSLAQRQWFMKTFARVGKISVDEFEASFVRLAQYFKGEQKHVIVFGCSSLDPDDQTHNYDRVEDTLSLRVHKFNLALLKSSLQEGISFVDVDRLIAELGGKQHVVKALHYSKEAYRTIAQEFLRIVADIGFFEARPLLMQMGQRSR